jgi:stage IV sporulation protein A
MIDQGIYGDIAKRTDGDFYIGVVGPVRTGKSTFIKKFMENAILPNITDERERMRAQDEMPQSAGGRTVMTSEPKFIPEEAAEIVCGNVKMRVRMVDCVGFLVDGALGQLEDGSPRLVRTPWTNDPIPFSDAAELGTKKVINEHSTVAFMVTCDGSISDIQREAYIEAERKAIAELKKSGVPFVIILNSKNPQSPDSEALALSLESEYGAPVALINCLETDDVDITHILGMILSEFPSGDITVDLPEWTDALEWDHPIMSELREALVKFAQSSEKVSSIGDAVKNVSM